MSIELHFNKPSQGILDLKIVSIILGLNSNNASTIEERIYEEDDDISSSIELDEKKKLCIKINKKYSYSHSYYYVTATIYDYDLFIKSIIDGKHYNFNRVLNMDEFQNIIIDRLLNFVKTKSAGKI